MNDDAHPKRLYFAVLFMLAAEVALFYAFTRILA